MLLFTEYVTLVKSTGLFGSTKYLLSLYDRDLGKSIRNGRHVSV